MVGSGVAGGLTATDGGCPLSRVNQLSRRGKPGTADIGSGPIRGEPQGHAALIDRQVGRVITFDDIVMQPCGVRAVHNQRRPVPVSAQVITALGSFPQRPAHAVPQRL
jgi:hypothetical protein